MAGEPWQLAEDYGTGPEASWGPREVLAHVEEIISSYQPEIALERDEMRRYLTENISYTADVSMQAGLELYYRLAEKHGLIERNKPLEFAT